MAFSINRIIHFIFKIQSICWPSMRSNRLQYSQAVGLLIYRFSRSVFHFVFAVWSAVTLLNCKCDYKRLSNAWLVAIYKHLRIYFILIVVLMVLCNNAEMMTHDMLVRPF